MKTDSNPFVVAVTVPASVNSPGDYVTDPSASPLRPHEFTSVVDPFEKVTWTFKGGIAYRNGKATTPRVSGDKGLWINLQSVWVNGTHGVSYWNVASGAWLWDGNHGADGNFQLPF